MLKRSNQRFSGLAETEVLVTNNPLALEYKFKESTLRFEYKSLNELSEFEIGDLVKSIRL